MPHAPIRFAATAFVALLGACALTTNAPPPVAESPGVALPFIADQLPHAALGPPPASAGLAETADESELNAALLSWAVTLSGLPAATPPRVRRMPHAYFVANACFGRECKVLGWFPPGDTVYVDERLDASNDLLAASIVVHEMVHYLQYRAASQGGFSCEKTLALERQAYGVQRDFITRYGSFRTVGASMHQVGCTPG